MSHPIVQNTKLKCDKGTKETPIQITSQTFSQINGKFKATEEDKQANTNIIPFGECKLKPTSRGYLPCNPALIKWQNTSPFSIEGKKNLITDSFCKCSIGGTITPIIDSNSNFITLLKKTEEDKIMNCSEAESEGTPSESVNGHFYNENGKFEGIVKSFKGDINEVFVCEGTEKIKDENGKEIDIFNSYRKINIKNDVFLRIAGLAYAESGFADEVIKCIPFCITNRHQIYKNSGLAKYLEDSWTLNKTLIKMRNNWDDQTYAHKKHYGAVGNPAFRAFLNIKVNETIDYDKNAKGRNEKSQMQLAIQYTIKAIDYFNNNYQDEDPSDGSVGWQGVDIFKNKNWKNWLYIHDNHKLYGFKNWKNAHTLDKSISESCGVYKGSFGTTVLWKPTAYAYKLNPKTGGL